MLNIQSLLLLTCLAGLMFVISYISNIFSQNKALRFFCFLFVLMLVFHGLVLINNGSYWDGGVLNFFWETKNFHQLHVMFFSAGSPLTYFIHRLIWLIPAGFAVSYHVVALSCFYLSACLFYRIIERYSSSSLCAKIAALTFIIYPGCQLTNFSIMTPAYFLQMLFLMAWCFYIASSNTRGFSSLVCRLISLLLFVFSFSFNSLLCFYLVFILFHYSSQNRNLTFFNFRRTLYFVRSNIDFLLIPVLFWVFIKHYFPAYGDYANYNQIHFSNIINIHSYSKFTWHSLYPLVFWFFCIVLAINLVSVMFAKVWRENLSRDVKKDYSDVVLKDERVNYMFLMLMGVAAFFLAIFPYIAVGKISPILWHFQQLLLNEYQICLFSTYGVRYIYGWFCTEVCNQ